MYSTPYVSNGVTTLKLTAFYHCKQDKHVSDATGVNTDNVPSVIVTTKL